MLFSLNHADILPLSLKCIASTSDAIFWCGTPPPLFPVVLPIKDVFGYHYPNSEFHSVVIYILRYVCLNTPTATRARRCRISGARQLGSPLPGPTCAKFATRLTTFVNATRGNHLFLMHATSSYMLWSWLTSPTRANAGATSGTCAMQSLLRFI